MQHNEDLNKTNETQRNETKNHETTTNLCKQGAGSAFNIYEFQIDGLTIWHDVVASVHASILSTE